MFEKFKNLQWQMQLLVLVGIAALLYGGVYYFVTSGTRAEIQGLNEEISQLQAKNEAARVATQRINEFRALYASKTVEYDELKVLLPEQREITNVLQGLQETAGDSRLIVMRFSPRDDTQQEAIIAKPVEVEVDSNFTNLRSFFDKMAKLPRIVSITDFKINQLDKQTAEKTLHAQFLLTAYYAAPENLNQPVAPGKPGASVAGQPAAAAPARPVAH
ncbi:MAG TPA: type 4a pilus biogenesis protein PilO [Pyrinomonadaceae bacterium]